MYYITIFPFLCIEQQNAVLKTKNIKVYGGISTFYIQDNIMQVDMRDDFFEMTP